MADTPCRIVVDNDTTDGVYYWDGANPAAQIPGGSGIGTLMANEFNVPRVDLTAAEFAILQPFLVAKLEAEAILGYEAVVEHQSE